MTPREAARVVIEGADAALHGLLAEWLAEQGCRVVGERPDLILADLPPSPHGAATLVARLRRGNPGVPLLAISSGLFAGVEANGAIARALGVDSVLGKPLDRDALMRAVGGFLPPRG